MASSIIHIAVASELNKILKKNPSNLFVGAIAPDIAKLIGETKVKSHFLNSPDNQEPNIERFLSKYKDKLDDEFVLGYYIHLYTDYIWFKYFISEVSTKSMIKTLDGTTIWCNSHEFVKYIYNDYTNMNLQIIDNYNLDLKIFYNELPNFKPIIEEISYDKLNILIDTTGVIIANSKKNKDYIFNVEHVEQFIKTTVNLLLSNLQELGIY